MTRTTTLHGFGECHNTMLSHSVIIPYFMVRIIHTPVRQCEEVNFPLSYINKRKESTNKSHTRPTKVAVLPPNLGKPFRQPQLCYRTLPPATAGEFNSFPCKHGPLPITRQVAHRRKNVRCVTHNFYRAELKVSEFATVLWIYT